MSEEVLRGCLPDDALVVARMALQILPRAGFLGVQGEGGRASLKVPGGKNRGLDRALAAGIDALEGKVASPARSSGWGTWTPASAGIQPHSHDGDAVLAIYCAVPEHDPQVEPIVFPEISERVFPFAGLVLCWPSYLIHEVPCSSLRAAGGQRHALVWNLWFSPDGGP